ncbi:unnamed protein product [Lactuca saligna]|uniref:Uncharacterized protein n=1 Tax=Lactuca saligna TaxID=75948 RepID=A0AA36EBB1_LACSI|nr:unnamed protein product [Lactuca saligna]
MIRHAIAVDLYYYVYRMKFTCLKIVKRLPFVRNVTGSLLEKIENIEISVGGFGRQLPENFEDIGDDDGMVVEDDMLDGMMRDYGDEEEYVVVIKHSYGVILSEKKNIEKALKHGIEKVPNNLSLKEWCEKNKILFKEVNNAESGGMKAKDPSFDGDSNKGDADGGKEAEFSPIGGLAV